MSNFFHIPRLCACQIGHVQFFARLYVNTRMFVGAFATVKFIGENSYFHEAPTEPVSECLETLADEKHAKYSLVLRHSIDLTPQARPSDRE